MTTASCSLRKTWCKMPCGVQSSAVRPDLQEPPLTSRRGETL